MRTAARMMAVATATVTCIVSDAAYSAEGDGKDIVIYGATSAGIAAAVQARRMDLESIVIEPTDRIGGLTAGGLGQTDIGNKAAFGDGRVQAYCFRMCLTDDPCNHIPFRKPAGYREGSSTTSSCYEILRRGRWVATVCRG